ncbi:MAG: hypothetical protein AB1608_01595 [Thermoproteota archaeon]
MIIILTFWGSPIDIDRASAIIAVFSLIFALAIERAKVERKDQIKKNELSIYKRNLLFKLSGTLHAVQWAVSTYITYDVKMSTPRNSMINYLTLEDFRNGQFQSHKINYDDIRFFSASDTVPMEIKEKLDLINLDGEKLINFLPIEAGTINRGIFIGYIRKVLTITSWALKDEDSEELVNNARNLVSMIELLIDVTDFPKFKGFI